MDLNKPVVWVYALNATLLIVHEMDSVHLREWDLFSARHEGFYEDPDGRGMMPAGEPLKRWIADRLLP